MDCALCGQEVEAGGMRTHEIQFHWGYSFGCIACGNRFRCSQDLRRHSRSTRHAIPVAFRLPAEEFLDDALRELVAQERLEQHAEDVPPTAGEWTLVGDADERVTDILLHAGPSLPEGAAAPYQAGLLGLPEQARPVEHHEGGQVGGINETPHLEVDEDAERRGAAREGRVAPADGP